MRNKRQFIICFTYVLIDIFIAATAIYSFCVVSAGKIPFEPTFHNIFLDYKNPFYPIFYSLIFSLLIFNNMAGLYQTRRELLESFEVWKIIKSVFYSCLVTIFLIYILKIEKFPRSILILTGTSLTFLLSVWRIAKKAFVDFLVTRGYNNFNVVIIGAGKIGLALAEEIGRRPGLGFKIVGFLDDFKPQGQDLAGHKVIGKLSDFMKICREEFINKIFITIYHDSRVFIQMLEWARELNISVRVIPQGFEFSSGEFFKYNIGFIPILEYCDQENKIKQIGKRLFDFVLASSAIVVFSPLFIVLAVLIKGDSPGPVFYRSKRYGFRGKIFRMYKFRSMGENADRYLPELRGKNEVDGPIFKIREDPRVTRLGAFLRRYSLDELPQLFNVLKGDMSLVGPRPLPIEQIEKEDLRQLKRLEVRPGITGLWQIRGRSDISFVRLVKWDIWYINNWSFWLDMNILLQTIPVVLKGRGAY